jgi:hypothetical protein
MKRSVRTRVRNLAARITNAVRLELKDTPCGLIHPPIRCCFADMERMGMLSFLTWDCGCHMRMLDDMDPDLQPAHPSKNKFRSVMTFKTKDRAAYVALHPALVGRRFSAGITHPKTEEVIVGADKVMTADLYNFLRQEKVKWIPVSSTDLHRLNPSLFDLLVEVATLGGGSITIPVLAADDAEWAERHFPISQQDINAKAAWAALNR